MSYEMYLLELPERQVASEVPEAHPDPGYLCLDLHAMAHLRAIMDVAGMLGRHGEPAAHPGWEHLGEKTLDGQRFRPDAFFDGVHYTPEQESYFDALSRWRRYRAEGDVGVQAWKLGSNDGWIVTAEECLEALQTWDSHPSWRQQGILAAVVGTGMAESDESVRSWQQTLERIDRPQGGDRQRDQRRPEVIAVDDPTIDLSGSAALWVDWLEFLRLGAQGDGFMVE